MSGFKSINPDDPAATLRERIQGGAAHCAQPNNHNVVITHQSNCAICRRLAFRFQAIGPKLPMK